MLRRFILILVIICFFAPLISAQEIALPKSELGLKIGFFSSGTLDLSRKTSTYESNYDTEGDICGGLYINARTYKNIYTGVSLDLAKIKLSDYLKETLWVAGLNVKGKFLVGNSGLSVNPGIAIGYGFMSSLFWLDKSNYLTLTINNEVSFPFSKTVNYLLDIGLFWGLSGGDDTYDVSGGPFLLLRTGLSFNPVK